MSSRVLCAIEIAFDLELLETVGVQVGNGLQWGEYDEFSISLTVCPLFFP